MVLNLCHVTIVVWHQITGVVSTTVVVVKLLVFVGEIQVAAIGLIMLDIILNMNGQELFMMMLNMVAVVITVVDSYLNIIQMVMVLNVVKHVMKLATM